MSLSKKRKIAKKEERRWMKQMEERKSGKERIEEVNLNLYNDFYFLECNSKTVCGITTNVKYYCSSRRCYNMPRYVNEEEGWVVFYSNPGWIGNWYYKTSVENFLKYFSRNKSEVVEGKVPDVEYVDIRMGFDHPRVSLDKKFN